MIMDKLVRDNNLVFLRLPEPGDKEVLRRIRADTELQNQLMAYPPTKYIDDVGKWLKRRMHDENGFIRVIAKRESNLCVGFVQVADIHHSSRYGYMGVAIDPKQQGQGYGSAAIVELFNLATNQYGLHKLLLQVKKDNIKAINLYCTNGFRKVGTFRDHYLQCGSWQDVIIMEKIL